MTVPRTQRLRSGCRRCGIATRNGVVMVTHIKHLQAVEGVTDLAEAVRRGAEERPVPILMTAISAGLALVPLAIAMGEPGSEIQAPVAIVILSGLTSQNAAARILLTTFSRPLAQALEKRRDLLTEAQPELRERFAVHSLDTAALDLYTPLCVTATLASGEAVRTFIAEAREAGQGEGLTAEFLLEEWEELVVAGGVTDAAALRGAAEDWPPHPPRRSAARGSLERVPSRPRRAGRTGPRDLVADLRRAGGMAG